MTVRRMLRSGLTALLAVSLATLGPVPPTAVAEGVAAELETTLAQFERLDDGLDLLADALPDTHWSADDLSFELAFEEPEAIAGWVRNEIGFEAYRGLLRGPDGTLQARAANALDQSVLLAKLLFDAGYTARVVVGTIPRAAAQELVASMEVPAPVPDGAGRASLEPFLDTVDGSRDVLDAAMAEGNAIVDALRGEAASSVAWLGTTLADAGVVLGEGDPHDLVAEARDYAWVEYRLSDDMAWTAAHPAAPEGASWLDDPETTATLTGDVPPEFQHRFRFRAVVERRLGSELEVVPIMEAWERPVANLNGVALSYSSVPDGFLGADTVDATPREAHEATEFVVPVFNEALAPGGQYFDLLGNVVPPDAAESAAAGVFENVGGLFGEAAGALSDEEEPVALTAHWLEFTLIEPGGRETTYRRTILDRLGEERRRSGDVSGDLEPMSDDEILSAMETTHTFMLAPGRYPAPYVQTASIDAVRSTADYLQRLSLASAEDDGTTPLPDAELSEVTRAIPLLDAFRAFGEAHAPSDDVLSYRATPSLAVLTNAWDGSMQRTDIVHNARRVFRSQPGAAPVANPQAALETGVWETAVERLLLESGGELHDTLSYFEDVRAEALPVVVVPPGDATRLGELDLPSDSLEAMRRDVERGYAVVTATSLPRADAVTAWWRVDPATGETLGRGGDGRGQAIMEYVQKAVSIEGALISAVFGGAGFATCMSTGGNVACCLLDAATGVVVGFGAGLLLAIAEATAATSLAVGAALDFGATNAGFAGALGVPIPTWCWAVETPADPSRVLASAPPCGVPNPFPRAIAGADGSSSPVVAVARSVRVS